MGKVYVYQLSSVYHVIYVMIFSVNSTLKSYIKLTRVNFARNPLMNLNQHDLQECVNFHYNAFL